MDSSNLGCVWEGRELFRRDWSWSNRTTLLAVILVALLAGAAPAVAGAEQGKPALSLEDARKLAIEGNDSYAAAKLDFDAANIQLEMARAEGLVRPSVVATKRAENARKNASRALVARREALMVDVDSTYYALVAAQEGLAIRKKAEEQATESLRIVKLRLGSGLASKLEAMATEIQLERARAEVKSAESDLELAALALKQVLGLDLSTSLVATDSAVPLDADMGFEAGLALALKNRPEIVQAREALEIAELEVKFSDNEYTPELTRRLNRNSLEKARIQLEQAERAVYVEARRLCLATLGAARDMKASSAAAGQAEENYRVMKLRYEYGMEIANSLLGAQVDLTEARLASLRAVMNYNTTCLRYENYVGYPADGAE